MRPSERRHILCLLLLLFLVVRAGLACGAELRVAPSVQTVRVGDTVAVDVPVDSVTTLAGFQFNFSFDPTILRVTSISINGGFDRPLSQAYDNIAGRGLVAAYALTSPPLTGTPVTLATVVFTAAAAGTSAITLGNQVLGLPGGEELSSTLATGAVSLTVLPADHPPVANNGSFTTAVNTALTGALSASDSDGDPLVYSIVANGTKGSAAITSPATGAFTYTPNAGAAGTDTFTFVANDGLLGSNIASVTVTIIDSIPPTVTAFTTPAASSSLTVPLTVVATDDVGVTGYLASELSSPPTAADSRWSAAAPGSYTFATAGTKTLYAFAKDAAGNVSGAATSTVTVTLPDTTPPTVTAFTLPATATSLTVPVTSFTAADDTGVTGYLLSEASTQPLVTDPGWTPTPSASYTFATAGTKTLYAFAKDAAGNISGAATSTVTVILPDTTPPTVSAFTLPATATSLTVPVTSFTATDDTGVTGYLLSEASTQPLVTDPGWTPTPSASYTFATAGAKTLYGFAKDAAGNVSGAVPATVTITLPDTTPPTVTAFTLPSAATSLTVPVTSFAATDDTGVTGYLLSEVSAQPLVADPAWTPIPSPSYTFATAGANTLYGFAKDAAGNVSGAAAATVTITLPDTTPPAVTAFTLPPTAVSLTVPVTTFTASDDTGVTGYLLSEASIQPLVTDPGWTPTPSASYTFATAGAKTLFAFAKDAAGNVSAAAVATVTITLPDTTPPTVTAFALPASATSLTVPITSFTASDDTGVTGYLLGEASTQPLVTDPGWTPTPSASYTFATVGAKTLYAFAKDAAGNVSGAAVAMVSITLPDTTPPTVTAFALPATAASLTVPVTTFTASDDTGVTGYLLSESPIQPLVTDPGWTPTPSASYTFATAGAKTLDAFAKDAAGNVSAAATATVSITLPVTYPVTLTPGANGTITGPLSYAAGSTPTYAITPAPGYHVAAVTANGSAVGAVASYTLPAGTSGPITIAATFAANSYTVTPSVIGSGAMTPATPQAVTYNGTASFVLAPAIGYHLASVGGTCGGTVVGNTYTTAAITADCTVVASFAADAFQVAVIAGSGGTVTVNGTAAGTVTVAAGGSQTFTITPISGYHIVDVQVDGASVGAVASYTFMNITTGHTLSASFAPPDGHLASDAGGEVTVADALLAMQIAVGLVAPTPDLLAHGDVAPLVNGKPAPNGKIDLGDAIVLLRRAVGLVTSW